MDEIVRTGSVGAAPPAAPATSERRVDPRHLINGPAWLIDGHGAMHHVRLVDLSAGGAKLSRPPVAELFVGVPVTVAGQAMPWERRCVIVALSDDSVHVRFA